MPVCCTFRLIFVNKSILTADIALLPTQIIRGTFRTFANLTTKFKYFTTLKKYTYLYFVTSKSTSKNCTLLLKKSKLFYLSKVTK